MKVIRAEKVDGKTVAEVKGDFFNVLMEFTALCRSLVDVGIREEDLVMAIALSKHMDNYQKFQGEDAKLAKDFMEELTKRVKEKREAKDAQANKSDSDT
jgi:hypothetical protein